MKELVAKVSERRILRVIPEGRSVSLPNLKLRWPLVSRERAGLLELAESGVR